jgi:ABC-type nitrate/sulfonate/bicarbonate transport system substrate-binding protein
MKALTRTAALSLTAAFAITAMASDASADWREKHKVLRIGSVTVETQGATISRYKPFVEYLQNKLGVKVEIFTASDYAGIVQALSAGQIHLARMGGAEPGLRLRAHGLLPRYRDLAVLPRREPFDGIRPTRPCAPRCWAEGWHSGRHCAYSPPPAAHC